MTTKTSPHRRGMFLSACVDDHDEVVCTDDDTLPSFKLHKSSSWLQFPSLPHFCVKGKWCGGDNICCEEEQVVSLHQQRRDLRKHMIESITKKKKNPSADIDVVLVGGEEVVDIEKMKMFVFGKVRRKIANVGAASDCSDIESESDNNQEGNNNKDSTRNEHSIGKVTHLVENQLNIKKSSTSNQQHQQQRRKASPSPSRGRMAFSQKKCCSSREDSPFLLLHPESHHSSSSRVDSNSRSSSRVASPFQGINDNFVQQMELKHGSVMFAAMCTRFQLKMLKSIREKSLTKKPSCSEATTISPSSSNTTATPKSSATPKRSMSTRSNVFNFNDKTVQTFLKEVGERELINPSSTGDKNRTQSKSSAASRLASDTLLDVDTTSKTTSHSTIHATTLLQPEQREVHILRSFDSISTSSSSEWRPERLSTSTSSKYVNSYKKETNELSTAMKKIIKRGRARSTSVNVRPKTSFDASESYKKMMNINNRIENPPPSFFEIETSLPQAINSSPSKERKEHSPNCILDLSSATFNGKSVLLQKDRNSNEVRREPNSPQSQLSSTLPKHERNKSKRLSSTAITVSLADTVNKRSAMKVEKMLKFGLGFDDIVHEDVDHDEVDAEDASCCRNRDSNSSTPYPSTSKSPFRASHLARTKSASERRGLLKSRSISFSENNEETTIDVIDQMQHDSTDVSEILSRTASYSILRENTAYPTPPADDEEVGHGADGYKVDEPATLKNTMTLGPRGTASLSVAKHITTISHASTTSMGVINSAMKARMLFNKLDERKNGNQNRDGDIKHDVKGSKKNQQNSTDIPLNHQLVGTARTTRGSSNRTIKNGDETSGNISPTGPFAEPNNGRSRSFHSSPSRKFYSSRRFSKNQTVKSNEVDQPAHISESSLQVHPLNVSSHGSAHNQVVKNSHDTPPKNRKKNIPQRSPMRHGSWSNIVMARKTRTSSEISNSGNVPELSSLQRSPKSLLTPPNKDVYRSKMPSTVCFRDSANTNNGEPQRNPHKERVFSDPPNTGTDKITNTLKQQRTKVKMFVGDSDDEEHLPLRDIDVTESKTAARITRHNGLKSPRKDSTTLKKNSNHSSKVQIAHQKKLTRQTNTRRKELLPKPPAKDMGIKRTEREKDKSRRNMEGKVVYEQSVNVKQVKENKLSKGKKEQGTKHGVRSWI
eukprot:m.91924 g.91924  ORF g.91924 m.91924 type:complete len:1169 (+) comp12342_c0_seq3:114-3620(+)